MKNTTVLMLNRIIVALVTPVLIIILLLLYFNSEIVRELIQIILASYILAYLFRPLQRQLLKRGVNKSVAAILIIFSLILIVAGFIYFLIPVLFKESLNIELIIYEGESIINDLMKKIHLTNISFININTSDIYSAIDNIVIKFSQNIIDKLLGFGDAILKLAIIPVLTYYLISDGDFISKKLLLVLPGKERQLLKSISKDIDRVLSRYIISQLILSIIISVLTFIALIIMKVDFPLWLAIFNGFLNIIPYFGPLLGAIPAILFALLESAEKAIFTAILLFIIQQIEGDILSPKLIGDCVNIHPILIIVLLLLGQQLGGFVWMVLAVPVAVIIKVIYEDINYHLF